MGGEIGDWPTPLPSRPQVVCSAERNQFDVFCRKESESAPADKSRTRPSPLALFAVIAGHPGEFVQSDESAGKRRSGKTRRGNPWLRDALVEAGNAASHTKTTALAARYRRLMRHRGYRKALVAVGRSILEIAYHLFTRATTYQELGSDYFDAQHSERLKRHSLALLQRLGYRVIVVPAHA
jgi:hypothetical protein